MAFLSFIGKKGVRRSYLLIRALMAYHTARNAIKSISPISLEMLYIKIDTFSTKTPELS